MRTHDSSIRHVALKEEVWIYVNKFQGLQQAKSTLEAIDHTVQRSPGVTIDFQVAEISSSEVIRVVIGSVALLH